MRTSFRSRCHQGSDKKVKLRVRLEAMQDAYDPRLCLTMVRDDRSDLEQSVSLPYDTALGLHRELGRMLQHMIEGH